MISNDLSHEAAVREVSVKIAFDARNRHFVHPHVDLMQLGLLELFYLLQHVKLHADGPLLFSSSLSLLRKVRRQIVSSLAAGIFSCVNSARH